MAVLVEQDVGWFQVSVNDVPGNVEMMIEIKYNLGNLKLRMRSCFDGIFQMKNRFDNLIEWFIFKALESSWKNLKNKC